MKRYILIVLCSQSIFADYFKARPFWENPYWGEPILDKDWLFNFTTIFKSGSTDEGLDYDGRHKNILNIYGPTNLKTLTKGVPAEILNRYPTSPINGIWSSSSAREFGKITFNGDFRVTSLNFYATQNFERGFFSGLFFQIENHKLKSITYKDSTRNSNDLPSSITQNQWQTFINNFFTNIQKYGVNMPNAISTKGLNQLDTYFGWTRSFTQTEHVDFVDFTGIVGIRLPIGTEAKTAFNLNHNFGRSKSVIISGRIAVGLWNWLTVGFVLGAQVYKKRCANIPMKTDTTQCGLIKLASGAAIIDKKPLINWGIFLKAEHFYKRFSLLFAYQYTKQKETFLEPKDTTVFSYEAANSDCALRRWEMQTLNFAIDYEFATEHKKNLPRVGVFFDIPIDGNLIFKTKQCGLGISIKTVW